ncbi:CPBP family intramembrane metalloprotease [Streptomyces actuosus]|uniref:CPBP family intramembrane metalloprotease n=1 Tax=Streptomyces actuosus TaxID=1885 RepID=A0ABS2VTJ4_STRAS|nr:CPBP family intramembrane glutamic endopeptidase [Streptomyces actuosus]MBN0046443.1 CPBP family intramembrane metalloprotease [Streptomyces actuosus]
MDRLLLVVAVAPVFALLLGTVIAVALRFRVGAGRSSVERLAPVLYAATVTSAALLAAALTGFDPLRLGLTGRSSPAGWPVAAATAAGALAGAAGYLAELFLAHRAVTRPARAPRGGRGAPTGTGPVRGAGVDTLAARDGNGPAPAEHGRTPAREGDVQPAGRGSPVPEGDTPAGGRASPAPDGNDSAAYGNGSAPYGSCPARDGIGPVWHVDPPLQGAPVWHAEPPEHPPSPRPSSRAVSAGERSVGAWTARPAGLLALGLLTALAEEVLFRGYLLAGLRHSLALWAALIVQAAVFAVHHASFGLRAVPAKAAHGLVWGALTAAAGTLLPAVAAHVVFQVLVCRRLTRTQVRPQEGGAADDRAHGPVAVRRPPVAR